MCSDWGYGLDMQERRKEVSEGFLVYTVNEKCERHLV